MVGWILLGKIKKVSSIMVDVWSIWIRRGHFLFLYSELYLPELVSGAKYPCERNVARTLSCCETGSLGSPSMTNVGICLMGLNASGTSL